MGDDFLQNIFENLIGGIISATIVAVVVFFFRDSFVRIGNRIRFRFNNTLPGNLKQKFIDVSNQTLENIKNSKTKIRRLNQLHRQEVGLIREIWDGGINGLLLVGEAGTGKSGIAAILANELQKEDHFVLLLNADEIREPIDSFRKDYFQGQSIFTFLRELTEFKECYIVFDQLDSVQNSDQLENYAVFLQELSRISKVRVLGVSRTYEAENFLGIKNIPFQRIGSDSLSKNDAEKYLKRLEILNPTDDLVELSRNLLNLSLIAQVKAFGKETTEITGELELWELFLTTIQEREGDEALSLLVEMAMLEAENEAIKLSFGQDHFPGVYNRLKSRQLILPAGGRKYRFFHQKFRDFLCAKNMISEDYRPSDYLERFGYSTGTNIINWVLELYRKDGPDVENNFIKQTIEDEGLPFYVKAALFDSYLSKEKSELDEQIVNQILLVRQYQRFFFENLDDSGWVNFLYGINFLTYIPDPVEDFDNPGYFSNPPWWAGEYLKRMAMHFPETVRDVALKLDTENGRAIRTMLEAIVQISPSIAAETVGSFERWAKTRFVHSMMIVYEMGFVMDYLAKNGEIDAALEILRVITEPFPIQEKYREGTTLAGTRHDIYWLKKVLFESTSNLINEAPLGVIEVIENRLIESIDLEVHPKQYAEEDFKNHSYWRLNIDPDLDSDYRQDIKNMLVNVLLNAFYKACEKRKEEVSECIDRYLTHEYAIFRRVAVHLLRIYGDNYKELVEEAYQINKERENLAFRSEFKRFIEGQFQNFSQEIKAEILESIYAEKDEPKFTKWMEEWIGKDPERFEGETDQEKEASFIEEIRFRELHRFSTHLFGKYLNDYNSWKEKYEPPEPVVEGVVTVTDEERPEVPITEENISKYTFPEIVEKLIGFVPQQDQRIRHTTRSDQGMVIEADVLNRVEDYSQNAMLFKNNKLPFTYHTYLFRGFENALKADKKFLMEHLIELAEYLVDVKEDKFERLEYEPGLDAAKEAIASFFDSFLRTKEPYLEEKSLARIGGIIEKLLWVDDPYLEKEVDPNDPSELDARTMDTNLDAATRSLHSIRGQAMHALIMFGLYSERKRKSDGGVEKSPVMVDLVRDALEQKLDKSKDDSLAVHSVFGWYFPQLMYLDEDWALTNLDKIFPREEGKIQYWLAAWSAYVRFSDVYTNVFPKLVPNYQFSLQILEIEHKENSYDRLDERLAEHIMKAYLFGTIELDSEDKLVKSYHEKASDEVRSRGVLWLSKVVGGIKQDEDTELWQRIWPLWQWRLEVAEQSDNQSDFVQELSDYLRILESVPLDLDRMYDTLDKSLKYMPRQGFEIGLYIAYLAKQSEEHPNLAVELLHKVISTHDEYYLVQDTKDNIAKIFGDAENASAESTQKVIEIVNIFGERGDFSWRPWLEKMG